MNVAIYLRKSRADENNPAETLEKHKEILLSFAKENNLNVIDIFEEVISGGMLYTRTEMLKLLDNASHSKYDAILCIDLDRLGRGSAADSEKIFDVLKDTNTKIITLRKTYDLNNEYDEDYSEFEMFMARKELKFITRRMNRGRIKSISDGCFVSGAPFGYRNTIKNKKHTLEIYEPEAKYVRMIFDMYVNQHLGITTISHTLEELGVKSKKGTSLNRSTISRMLKNHTYTGKIVWNKSKSVKGAKSQVATPPKDWLWIEGLHPPIIDDETFNKAQKIKQERFITPINRGVVVNPLSGILKCANCGKTMILNSSSETLERGRIICRTVGCNKASALSIVEDKILEGIRRNLDIMESSVKSDKRRRYDEQANTQRIIIADALRELKTLDNQQLKLYDLLEQGIYSNEVFIKRGNIILERRKKLEDIISKARLDLKNIDITDIQKKIPILRDLLERYKTLNPEQKNILLKNILEKIEYRRNKDAKEGDIYLKLHFK